MLGASASDPIVFFGAFALLIFLGFAGNMVFQKLNFNDTLILIFIGLLIGPIFMLIDANDIRGAVPIVGSLALILILFEGGIGLRIHDLVHGVGSSMVLALTGFIFTTIFVAAVAYYTLEVPFMAAVTLGGILGGTSAVVVMPSLAKMRCEKRTATMLSLESAITDILVVVSVSTLLAIQIASQQLTASGIAGQVIILFSMSLFFGATAGFLWLLLVPQIREKEFGYMMTMGAAFAVFVFTEWVLRSIKATSGGGPLAVLAFGVVLGNATSMGSSLRKRVGDAFGQGLAKFQGEISFLVRTFFFVYLGLIVDLEMLKDVWVLAVGVLVFAALVAARYLAVVISERRTKFRGDDWILFVMMPRGLASAVMAAEVARGLGYDEFVAIAFLSLVLTNLLGTVGGMVIGKKGMAAGGPRTPAGATKKAKPTSKAASKPKAPTRSRAPRQPPGQETVALQNVEFSGRPIKKQASWSAPDATPAPKRQAAPHNDFSGAPPLRSEVPLGQRGGMPPPPPTRRR